MRDNHLHTHFSYDSDASFEDYLTHYDGEIVTTEHYDLSNPYTQQDDVPDYEAKLQWVEQHLHLGEEALLKELVAFPSIQFGVEQAFRSVAASQWYELFPSDFTMGKDTIPINGLIWMGSPDFMKAQIKEKLAQGFHCIKMKIGAIDFEEEYRILKALRNEFSASDIHIEALTDKIRIRYRINGILKEVAEIDKSFLSSILFITSV